MTTYSRCSICNKGRGTCLCTGCKAHFCKKHFNDHHVILLNQLNGCIEERNTVQNQIDKTNYHDDYYNAIVLQIDDWQQTTIEKVIQTAEQARQQVKLASSKRMEIITNFKELSGMLDNLKETEDFVEDDLVRLNDMIDKLKQNLIQLDKSPTIELNLEESNRLAWDQLIYVQEKPLKTDNKRNEKQIEDNLPTVKTPDEKCRTCETKASLKCAKCYTAIYCSKECQRQDWPKHKINCSSGRTKNSADHLVKAAMSDEFPEDIDTLNDFGFSKCQVQDERTKLLGMYIGLIEILGVRSEELHQWQQANELALNIRRTYENAGPRATSGYYYVWFLENQYLVDSQTSNADIFQPVQKYLSPEDKNKDIDQLQPVAKRRSIGLYVVLLMGNIPSIEQDLWMDFGFCTCKNQAIESELGRIYRTLIDRCTMYEFYTNYESKSLETLLHSKNVDGVDSLKEQGVIFRLPIQSVYYLKQYILGKNIPLQLSVSVDYGFACCKSQVELQKLTKIYQNLFQHKKFDILRLHEACISGTLYKYASQFVMADSKLMRNPYPLLDL